MPRRGRSASPPPAQRRYDWINFVFFFICFRFKCTNLVSCALKWILFIQDDVLRSLWNFIERCEINKLHNQHLTFVTMLFINILWINIQSGTTTHFFPIVGPRLELLLNLIARTSEYFRNFVYYFGNKLLNLITSFGLEALKRSKVFLFRRPMLLVVVELCFLS